MTPRILGRLLLLRLVLLTFDQPPLLDTPEQGKSNRVDKEGFGKDIHGDDLPVGAIARLGTVRFRHDGRISSIAFSPDGKMLASAGAQDLTIRLWQNPKGKEIRRWFAHQSFIAGIAFSPDGRTVASAGDRGVDLSRVETGERIRHLASENEWFRSVAFSLDGSTLAAGSAGSDGIIRLWKVATGNETLTLQGHTAEVLSLAFSHDGKFLASAGRDKIVRLWRTETGKGVLVLNTHDWPVAAVAFSPDDQILASADSEDVSHNAGLPALPGEHSIRLWKVDSGQEMQRLKGGQRGFVSIAFANANNSLVSAGLDGRVRQWDIRQGKELHRFADHLATPSSLAISPDGKILASTAGNSIVLWDLESRKSIAEPTGHQAGVSCAAFSRDGKTLFSGAGDYSCRVWEVGKGRELSHVQNDQIIYGPIGFSSDGKTLTTYGPEPRGYHVWELPAVKEVFRLLLPANSRFQYVACSPDGKMLAAQEMDGTISLWNFSVKKQIQLLKGHDKPLEAMAFSLDGRMLATIDRNGLTIVWELPSGKELRRLYKPKSRCHFAALSPDCKSVCEAGLGYIILWELATGKERARIEMNGKDCTSLAFAPDGKCLAGATYDWNPGRTRGVEGQNPTVRIWNLLTAKPMGRFQGHSSLIRFLTFSPDARVLASTSDDTTIMLWDVSGIQCGSTSADVSSDWAKLRDNEATTAWQAVGRLVGGGTSTVSFVKDQLQPAEMPMGKNIDQLVKDLDDAAFSVREEATKDLEKLEGLAQPQLEKALASKPSAELKRRAETLLGKITGPVTSPDKLQILRAIEVLEHIGTSEAQEVLKTLSEGAPEARVTREAKASLDRLAKRAQAKP